MTSDTGDSFTLAISNNKLFARPKKSKQSDHESFFQYAIAGKDSSNSVLDGLKIPSTLLCEFCEGKLENPVKLDCEHVLCESCAVIIYQKDKKSFEEKMKKLRKTNYEHEEAIDENLKITKDRDLKDNLIGKSLKEDENINEEKIKKKLESVLKGECINCKFRLNGIFNKVDRLLNFLEKAQNQKKEEKRKSK
jgi:hypothetical protein